MPRWFEEGGEKRKLTTIVPALSIAVVMVFSQPVAAGTLISIVEDSEGDLAFGVDPKTGGLMNLLNENTPVAQAGYFDMVSTWLSLKKGVYTFGMELAANLPEEGAALPAGIKLGEWAVWIDPSPYNYVINPVAPLFLIALRYDGVSYSAFIMDYATMLSVPATFSVDGSEFTLKFTTSSIGDLELEWWCPMVRVWWGTAGYWFVDVIDLEPIDGYVYFDLPWPPE